MIRVVAMFQGEPSSISRVRPPYATLPRHPHQTPVVKRAAGSPMANPVRVAEIVTIDDAPQELQLTIIERIPSPHTLTLPVLSSARKTSQR